MTSDLNRPAAPGQEFGPPFRQSSRRLGLFVFVAALGSGIDLVTKQVMFAWRGMPGEQPIWWLWRDYAGIETSLNTGALFGLGQNRVWLFALFSVFALIGLVIWFVSARIGRDLLLTIVLGAIAGGILGNLYDRLGLWSPPLADGTRIHAVRDWIRLSWGNHVWPNFNVADSLLVCGAAFLVGHSLCQRAEGEPAGASRPPAETDPSTPGPS